MTLPLWQRQALNPENLETLWLLDVAWHLKNTAYQDTALREQLSSAWSWCFKTENAPSWGLRPGSNAYAQRFTVEQAREEQARGAAPETLPDQEGAP